MNKDEYLFILHATRTELVIPLDDKVHQDMNGIKMNLYFVIQLGYSFSETGNPWSKVD